MGASVSAAGSLAASHAEGATRSYTDIAGLRSLKTDTPENLRAAAQQFESLFIGMVLKSMRDANRAFAEGSYLSSSAVQTHQQMLDQQWSVHLARAGGIGLHDTIMRQLGGETATTAVADAAVQASGGRTFAPRPAAVRGGAHGATAPDPAPLAADESSATQAFTSLGYRAELFATPMQFVRRLAPLVERLVGDAGLPASAVVAQAALETGWGKQIIHDSAGRPSHNLFGIKADNWHGGVAELVTLEYRNGRPVQESAAFRAYDDWSESIVDYVRLLVNSPRYAGAVAHAQDPHGYADELSQAGYATDPNYAQKIKRIAAEVARLLQ